jgi:hypothetical protein
MIEIRHKNFGRVLMRVEGDSLQSQDLQGADLVGADLAGVDLRYSDLRGASLDSAELTGADLRGVRLWSASLQHADLRGADLRGANLRGWSAETNVGGSPLRGAKLRVAFTNGSIDNPALELLVPVRIPAQIVEGQRAIAGRYELLGTALGPEALFRASNEELERRLAERAAPRTALLGSQLAPGFRAGLPVRFAEAAVGMRAVSLPERPPLRWQFPEWVAEAANLNVVADHATRSERLRGAGRTLEEALASASWLSGQRVPASQ